MTWYMIRLDLARSPDHPEGSAAHSYLLRLPLDERGIVDLAATHARPENCTVLRCWPGQSEMHGYLRHARRGWVLSYEPGEGDDEAIFHLETHPLATGQYVTITEPDGAELCFRVVSCQPTADS